MDYNIILLFYIYNSREYYVEVGLLLGLEFELLLLLGLDKGEGFCEPPKSSGSVRMSVKDGAEDGSDDEEEEEEGLVEISFTLSSKTAVEEIAEPPELSRGDATEENLEAVVGKESLNDDA